MPEEAFETNITESTAATRTYSHLIPMVYFEVSLFKWKLSLHYIIIMVK